MTEEQLDKMLGLLDSEKELAFGALGQAASADPGLEERVAEKAPSEPPSMLNRLQGYARTDLGKDLAVGAGVEGALGLGAMAYPPLGAVAGGAALAGPLARKAGAVGIRGLLGAGIGLGVETADELLPKGYEPYPEPAPGEAEDVKDAGIFRKLRETAERHGYGQVLGDMVALGGGSAFRFAAKHIGNLAATVSPGGIGEGGRTWIRGRFLGRGVQEDDASLAALDSLMDLWGREGTMTAAEKNLIAKGHFQEFANSRFSRFAQETGPAMDMADFAKLVTARSKRGTEIGSTLYEAAFKDINRRVGGTLRQSGSMPAKLQGQILDAGGRPVPLSRENVQAAIGEFPSLTSFAQGGIDIDVRLLRRQAQQIVGPVRATNEPYQKLVSGFVEALGQLDDKANFLVVDAMRKDLGKAIRVLKQRSSAANPVADLQDLRALYKMISQVQTDGLKKAGFKDVAEDLTKLNTAYGAWKSEFDNLLMRQLGEAIDVNKKVNAATVAKTLDGLTPSQLDESLRAFGPDLTKKYRAVYGESLLRDSLTESADTALTTLDGKKLAKAIRENEDTLRVLFKDSPQVIPNLRQLASVFQAMNNPKLRDRIAKAGVSANVDGVFFNQVTQQAGKPLTVTVQVPHELIPGILADKWASKSFLSRLGAPLARTSAGAVGRRAQDDLREFVASIMAIDFGAGAPTPRIISEEPIETDPDPVIPFTPYVPGIPGL